MIKRKICVAINTSSKYDREYEFLNGILYKVGKGFPVFMRVRDEIK